MTSKAEPMGPLGPDPPFSDEEVVRRVRGGEPALFGVLMRRYNQRLYRVARVILKDETEAEDVMQQAYVNAYTHLQQFEARASFSTWLIRIAVNEARARLRRRSRRREVDAMPETDERTARGPRSGALNPEEQAVRQELRTILESSLEAIPESYRSVFVLREVEGLDTAETADCLGLSEDNVKTRLHRARGLLRRELFERAGIASAELFPLHLSRCDRVVAAVFEHLRQPPPATLRCGCPGEFCQVGPRAR